MKESSVLPTTDQNVMEEPFAGLEKMYIEVYLRSKGHTLHGLHDLPEEEVKRLMTEASLFASTKLAEVETRAQFVQEIHQAALST